MGKATSKSKGYSMTFNQACQDYSTGKLSWDELVVKLKEINNG